MTTEDVLYSLLVASLAVSCLLILAATVMIGKKLADRSYQRAAEINGTNAIQNTKELRTHAMRIVTGVTFSGFAILLMADAPVLTRQWFNRSLFVLVPLGYLVATVLDWFAERQQMRIEVAEEQAGRRTIREQAAHAEAKRLATLQADHDAYREMAAEAVANLKAAAAQVREARGEPPMPEMAAVVPEHSSPVSEEQEATAERATMRADLTASTLTLGLPAREADTPTEAPASPQIIVSDSVAVAAMHPDTVQAIVEGVTAVQADVVTIQPEAVQSIVDAIDDARPEPKP